MSFALWSRTALEWRCPLLRKVVCGLGPVLLISCGSQPEHGGAADELWSAERVEHTAAFPEYTADPAPNALSADDALAARNLAAQYLKFIGQKDYKRALELWDDYGRRAFRNRPADLASHYDRYTRFAGTVGPPDEITGGSGNDHVVVPATAAVRLKGSGEERSLFGLIYLARTKGGAERWQVTAVDIRRRR